ncbi:MAG: GNAT family N-acetyltransferase [Chloroflexi bacterium]|nr:GNAT family N-acetyltransferase [Chloroflexota bacterium]
MSESGHPLLPPGIHLRRAQAADQAAIRSLVAANHLNPLSLRWQDFVVAVDSPDQVVGIGQVKQHSDGSRELASIAVVGARRRQGIARAIILELMSTNPAPLYLTCRSALGPFYARFGFVALGIEQMPLYFRRIYRLARLLMRSASGETQMLVMGILSAR